MDKILRQKILDLLRDFSTPGGRFTWSAARCAICCWIAQRMTWILSCRRNPRAGAQVSCQLDGALYILDEERDTTRVVLDSGVKRGEPVLLDFASLRANDLEGDLRARDFTINAMAIDVAQPESSD